MKGAQEFISEAPSAIVQSNGQVSGLVKQAETALQGTANDINLSNNGGFSLLKIVNFI